jgi:hypothetical protein
MLKIKEENYATGETIALYCKHPVIATHNTTAGRTHH